MFDLFRSRDKAVRYVLGGMLMIVALSMVVTLIPGFGSSTRADDTVIAEVGKDAITVRQVQNELQSLVRDRQVPPQMLQIYAPQFIDQMIQERAVAYQASRMGMQITDADLATTIRERILPQLFSQGQLDKAAYENMLTQRGMSIPEFEEMVRKEILSSRMRNLAMEGVVVTPQEARAQYEKSKQKAKVEYIAFKPDDLKSQAKVAPEDLKTYYDANKNNYVQPEKRDLALLIADQEKIGASINVPEAQLQQAYQSRRDQFRTPERVRVRHILVKTTGKTPAETEKLKQKAADLLKQLKGGADFATLAKANSDDPGSAVKGGELGWVTRGQTVKNFEQAAFSLKPNQLSDLISTEYGFHILQVEEKQDAHTQTLDEVKGQLAAELKKQVVFERMQTAMDQARAALQKAPENLEQVASQYNLELVRVPQAGPGQTLPQLGALPDLDAALGGMKKGDVTPVFQAPGDKLVIAEVTNNYPAHIQPLTEVEARVRDTVIGQKARLLASERAAQAATRLKAGEDINKVAKELGGEVKTSIEFTTNDAIEGLGSATIFNEAFTKPVGSIIGPVPAAGDISVVAKVAARIPADPNGFAAAREGIVKELKDKQASERRELFYDSILAQLIKEGKVKKHNDTIKRLLASYRG